MVPSIFCQCHLRVGLLSAGHKPGRGVKVLCREGHRVDEVGPLGLDAPLDLIGEGVWWYLAAGGGGLGLVGGGLSCLLRLRRPLRRLHLWRRRRLRRQRRRGGSLLLVPPRRYRRRLPLALLLVLGHPEARGGRRRRRRCVRRPFTLGALQAGGALLRQRQASGSRVGGRDVVGADGGRLVVAKVDLGEKSVLAKEVLI